MTSAFFGGVAKTLLAERQAADAERRESDAYRKKKEIDNELDITLVPDYDRKVWLRVDGNGKEVGVGRAMTPSEIKDRSRIDQNADITLESAALGLKGAKRQEALGAEFDRDDRIQKREAGDANIEQSRAATESSRQSTRASGQRMRLDQEEADEKKEDRAGRAEDFGSLQLTALANTLATRFEDPRAQLPQTTYSQASSAVQRILADANGLNPTTKDKQRAIANYMSAVISGLPQRKPSLDTKGATFP